MCKSIENVLTKEILIQKRQLENKSYAEIAKELNVSYSSVANYLKKYGLWTKEHKIANFKNLIGQRFNKLVVLKLAGSKSGNSQWLCQCDCGKQKIIAAGSLQQNLTKSCGCYAMTVCWKGYEDISGNFFNRMKTAAKARKLEWKINIKYLWKLWLKQDGKCALTGDKLVLQKDYYCYRKKYGYINIHTASLDRIDSSKGYIKGNLQWVHKDVNYMKLDFSEEKLLDICYKIVKQHKEKIKNHVETIHSFII